MSINRRTLALQHLFALLYDSGRVRQGRIAEMLTQDNLELLYQCKLEPAGGPEAKIFVPR